MSSSIISSFTPHPTASMMLAAWEVEPEACSVEKSAGSPPGIHLMKGDRFTWRMLLPSSAEIFMAVASVITSSLPSPSTWS